MASPSPSAGRVEAARGAGRHHARAATMTRKLRALSAKGAANPTTTTSAPAMAGPMARLTLIPRELSAIAWLRVSRGTSCGTMDNQAGAIKAAPQPSRKVKSRSRGAFIDPIATSRAKAAATSAIAPLTASSSLRRSNRSASAPEGSANRKAGAIVATCTSATVRGSGARSVISHPDPTVFIQEPILETTVATHSTAKARCRKGSQGDKTRNALGYHCALGSVAIESRAGDPIAYSRDIGRACRRALRRDGYPTRQ